MAGTDSDSSFTDRRTELIQRLKTLGFGKSDVPPLVSLEEFFDGNRDYSSIGRNLTPMLGPQYFYRVLKRIRSRPDVQDVLVEVNEIEVHHPGRWPFSNRVYFFTTASPEKVADWASELQSGAVEKGFRLGIPGNAPTPGPGVKVYALWWD